MKNKNIFLLVHDRYMIQWKTENSAILKTPIMTEFNARYNLKLFLPQKIISIFEKCHLRPDNIYIEQKRMLFFNHLNVCKSLQACIYRINEHTSSSVFLSE